MYVFISAFQIILGGWAPNIYFAFFRWGPPDYHIHSIKCLQCLCPFHTSLRLKYDSVAAKKMWKSPWNVTIFITLATITRQPNNNWRLSHDNKTEWHRNLSRPLVGLQLRRRRTTVIKEDKEDVSLAPRRTPIRFGYLSVQPGCWNCLGDDMYRSTGLT